MSKPRILHLITSLNIGGTEKFLLTVVKNLSHRYDFSVAYLKERGATADELERAGVKVFRTDFFALKEHLKKNGINIIHTHLYRANILGRLAGHLAGTQTVISSQRSIDGWKRFYHVWLDRFTSRYCGLIIANSLAAKDTLVSREGISPEKITVIYNSVSRDAEPVHANRGGGFTVGYVGRLHDEKGVYLLPEIIRRVLEKKSDFRFLIIGDGPGREHLQKSITKYGLAGSVEFRGWLTAPEEIYRPLDLLLLPSEEESFPQAVLEAFSFGVPAVAADVGGVGELIDDGKSGIIVRTRKPEDFAEAIIEMTDNNYGYRQFCENAKIKSLGFSLDRMIKSIDDIYGSLIEHDSGLAGREGAKT